MLFDVDQSALRLEAQTALIEAANKIARYAGASIMVHGHTDSTGGAEHNMTLSQARAESVRAFLRSRPELTDHASVAKGFGATRPIAPNNTDAGRQKNRRVEIVVTPRR